VNKRGGGVNHSPHCLVRCACAVFLVLAGVRRRVTRRLVSCTFYYYFSHILSASSLSATFYILTHAFGLNYLLLGVACGLNRGTTGLLAASAADAFRAPAPPCARAACTLLLSLRACLLAATTDGLRTSFTCRLHLATCRRFRTRPGWRCPSARRANFLFLLHTWPRLSALAFIYPPPFVLSRSFAKHRCMPWTSWTLRRGATNNAGEHIRLFLSFAAVLRAARRVFTRGGCAVVASPCGQTRCLVRH